MAEKNDRPERAESSKTPLPPELHGGSEAVGPSPLTARTMGRPRNGKRNDANGKQYTVMLEKETHLTALDLLHRHDEGWDLSD